MTDIILSWAVIWQVFFALFLSPQLDQVEEKIINSIRAFKNKSLILLENIKVRIKTDNSVSTEENELDDIYKIVETFIKETKYTSKVNSLVLSFKSFALLISFYYVGLILSALYIKSDFVHTYCGLYFIVFMLFSFLVYFSFYPKKINNILAIVLFPLLGTIVIVVKYSLLWVSNISETIKYAPSCPLFIEQYIGVFLVIATFLPFSLYFIFIFRINKLRNEQESIITDDVHFKTLKDLNEGILNKNKANKDTETANQKIRKSLKAIKNSQP